MTPQRLAEALKEEARRLGFADVGIVRPEASDHGAALDRWVEAGLHGTMGWMARGETLARRRAGDAGWPQARSLVVVADHYEADDPPGIPQDPSKGVIARYARGRDYHKVVHGKLRALHRWVQDQRGPEVWGRAYVDTGPLLERELGRRAGLGWFGRNTMLIHPKRGSYFFLGVLLLDLELATDPPFAFDHCGSCRACLDACPTDALLGRDDTGAPVLDANRCISYLTIEHRGPIPEELRTGMGNRVYGCDICQEVCPFTRKFSEPASEPGYAARGPGESPTGVEADPTSPSSWHPGTESPSLVDLLAAALDEESWDSFSRGSPIRRAGRAGFCRNVSVALGNWGSEDAVPVLADALEDPSPLVRGHAAWALGRISSPAAREVLAARSSVESDRWVQQELSSALDNWRPTGK